MKNKFIGTSGWSYKHWVENFYPENISSENFLDFYSKKFKTVEVNNSFYNLPDKKTLKNWRETTPSDFLFSIKASRYITHMKKLKDCKKPLNNFLENMKVLGEKLGPILFQLPGFWKCDLERLESFLKLLPENQRFVFELRNKTWLKKDTKKLLKKYNVGFCIYDFNQRESPKWKTADFSYIRLHGPDGKYKGKYSKKQLSKWKKLIKKEGPVFCYFDNDEKGYAPENAQKLKQMLD